MKYISLLSFIMWCATANCQVPGFMGKRFGVFLEANPTPAFFVQNSKNEVTSNFGGAARTLYENLLAFNFRPQITLEYLVTRDVSIGVSYSLLSAGTRKGTQVSDLDLSYNPDLDIMRGQAAGIHVKLYEFNTSASIPPIGYYQTFSLYVTQTNTYDDLNTNDKQFVNDFIYPVATIGIGRQSMILKNVVFKAGVEIGWAFVPFNFLSESESEWNEQEYAGYNLHQSLFGYYLFNINLSIGYLF